LHFRGQWDCGGIGEFDPAVCFCGDEGDAEEIRPENLELRFSLAIIVSVLIAWQTNMHDLSLLVLPAVLMADYCLRALRRKKGQKFVKRFGLLLPILPALDQPAVACALDREGSVNLMAIPLLWWVWEIGKELSDDKFRISSVTRPGNPLAMNGSAQDDGQHGQIDKENGPPSHFSKTVWRVVPAP
jgi:hypothetical protein